MVPGTASRLANDEMLEMRSYMNEGGKVLYTGKNAGVQYQDAYAFDPVANEPCGVDPAVTARCQLLSSDFLQYYLGAYLFNDGGGARRRDRRAVPRPRAQRPVRRLRLDPERRRRRRQPGLRRTRSSPPSSLLPEDQFPQFASDAPAEWDDGVAGRLRAGRRHAVHVLAARQPVLQAPVAHDRRARPAARRSPSRRPTTSSPTSTTCSSRRTRSAPTTGRRCRTSTATHVQRHRDQLHGRLDRGHPPVPQPLPDAQRRRDLLADGQHRLAAGRVERRHRPLGRLGDLGDRPVRLRRAGRSRSRSRRPTTRRSRGSTRSSTTSRSRPARARPRSRTTATRSTAGPSPGSPEGSDTEPQRLGAHRLGRLRGGRGGLHRRQPLLRLRVRGREHDGAAQRAARTGDRTTCSARRRRRPTDRSGAG